MRQRGRQKRRGFQGKRNNREGVTNDSQLRGAFYDSRSAMVRKGLRPDCCGVERHRWGSGIQKRFVSIEKRGLRQRISKGSGEKKKVLRSPHRAQKRGEKDRVLMGAASGEHRASRDFWRDEKDEAIPPEDHRHRKAIFLPEKSEREDS